VFLAFANKYLQLEKETTMALTSPGVEVTVIDESQYIPSAVNTVPYFLVATAQNKVSSDGVTVAAGTLAANANKTYLITSQRDLAATFGVPFFYNTTTGTPINGYELNEYGLLAAYSALGVTNRAYVQRADIDLTALTASLTRPTGAASNGAYWLDTSTSTWGIFEWNQTTGVFTNNTPYIINETDELTSYNADPTLADYTPISSVGSIGNYAVVTCALTNPVYFKNYNNVWVLLGSNAWKSSWPTVVGTNAPTTLTVGNNMYINDVLVTVGATNTVAGFAAVINTAMNATITAGSFVIGATYTILTVGNTSFTSIGASANTVGVQFVATGAGTGTGTATFNSGITATAVSNQLYLYANSLSSNDNSTLNKDGIIAINLGTSGGTALFTALGLTSGEYAAPSYEASYSYQQPKWITAAGIGARPTGSVWQNVSIANNGMNLSVKSYSSALGTWIAQNCPVFSPDFPCKALIALDPGGGGKNIPVGTTIAVSYASNYITTPLYTASFEIFERYAIGATEVTGTEVVSVGTPFTVGNQFTISATNLGLGTNEATATIGGTGTAANFVAAVSAANVPYVSASINSAGYIVFTHSEGGSIGLENITGTPVDTAGFTIDTPKCYYDPNNIDVLTLSNWVTAPLFTYTASTTAPGQDPADGRLWYYSSVSDADIMIQDNGSWMGYQNVTNDVRGYDLTMCNATGPIISATAPTTQTDTALSPLEYGDLWVDTSDLEQYPYLFRWQPVNNVDQWVEIDLTDQTTQNGILFADARWSSTGTVDPVADTFPTIESLLTSDYLDPDAPDPALYPQGTLLFNTRRSGYNVKSFQMDYFTTSATDYAIDAYSATTAYAVNDFVSYNNAIYVCTAATSAGTAPTNASYWSEINLNTWLTASGNKSNGSMWAGRLAQRQIIVEALKSGIDTSVTAREEQTQYNIVATPAYPELTPNMIALSNERNNTLFVVGDTPMRLGPDGNSLVAFATNNNGLGQPNGDGNIATSNYCGVFYPSCQTTDLGGNSVVQPPSHMMVRTILRSDAASYPWFAPAGTRRGVVDNALAIGYINALTGEFNQIGVSQSVRDILYERNINPITFIPGIGITNFGNKTSTTTTTALDRINVARLVCFLRGRLEEIGKLYLFEPNDTITRNQITNTVNSLMVDLVAKRALYDYLVVCDLSNNTPARIDRSELWVDIAIEPVKAVEFIYIPLRIKNTGAIAAGG